MMTLKSCLLGRFMPEIIRETAMATDGTPRAMP